MARELSIVLTSGALNDAVVATLAKQRHRLFLLRADTPETADRLRRHAYAEQVTKLEPAGSRVLPMPFLDDADEARNVSVERRLTKLAALMGVALRAAAGMQAVAIYTGLRVGPATEDLSKAAEFMQIWTEMARLTCGLERLEVIAPLLEMDAWQVVDLGVQLEAPLRSTWSCGVQDESPCGLCDGCRERHAAFQRAAHPDPLANQPERQAV